MGADVVRVTYEAMACDPLAKHFALFSAASKRPRVAGEDNAFRVGHGAQILERGSGKTFATFGGWPGLDAIDWDLILVHR